MRNFSTEKNIIAEGYGVRRSFAVLGRGDPSPRLTGEAGVVFYYRYALDNVSQPRKV